MMPLARLRFMVTLRDLHRFQTARCMVQLRDGRVGKIVRVDTTFPGNRTEVSVYTLDVPGLSPPPPTDVEEGNTPPETEEDFDDDLVGGMPASRTHIARVGLDQIVGLAKLP
jgi:hypothetical protein